MRKFDYDNNEEEFRDEVDKFFNDGEEIQPKFLNGPVHYVEPNFLEHKSLILDQKELNLKVYRTAVKIAENSFWWKFYSSDTRLNIINKIYKDIEEKNAKV